MPKRKSKGQLASLAAAVLASLGAQAVRASGGSSSYNFNQLAAFDLVHGDGPTGAVALDAAGDLYGTTADGGLGGVGTVY